MVGFSVYCFGCAAHIAVPDRYSRVVIKAYTTPMTSRSEAKMKMAGVGPAVAQIVNGAGRNLFCAKRGFPRIYYHKLTSRLNANLYKIPSAGK